MFLLTLAHIITTEYEGRKAMKLPAGITGFYPSTVPTPLCTDEKMFTTYCFVAARHQGGHIIKVNSFSNMSNYYAYRVESHNVSCVALLHHHFPLLAFSVIDETGKMTFTDEPVLVPFFEDEYTILTSSILHLPIDDIFRKEHQDVLYKDEWQQINYWKPTNIGELIFNLWD